ncbi:MAG: rhomboid family intramembrane serine protease [Bacteroidales bacterium]
MSYFGNQGGGLRLNMPPVVKNLIIINIIVYLATALSGDLLFKYLSLFYVGSPFFQPYQILTHMFMHGGFWHIFFNMYTLYIFGCVLENTWGSKKFLIYYLVCGIGAAILHELVMYIQVENIQEGLVAGQYAAKMAYQKIMLTPTVGASGAIYGLLLAYGMLFPENRLMLIFPPIALKAKWFVLIFGVIELLTGVFSTGDGIAHFAHLGGMIFGFILLMIWKKQNRMYY